MRFHFFKKSIIVILSIILTLVLGFWIYTLDYYRASASVSEYLISGNVSVEAHANYSIITVGDSDAPQTGLIFYPGGKVEAKAYLPLLGKLAERGVYVILVEMPLNLAVFDVNAAERLIANHPQVDKWYLSGHSLGGAMASAYCESHSDRLHGLILLGAYPVNDSPVETLAIYGEHDIKLDLDKVALADYVMQIDGGNHAYFGNYGEQDGDGTATISRQAQQDQTVGHIIDFIEKTSN